MLLNINADTVAAAHRRRARSREADPVHRRARHSRVGRRSALVDFVHRPRGPQAPDATRGASRTACCRRRRRSKTRSAAACVACTSSRTSRAGRLLARGVHERRHGHARSSQDTKRAVAGGTRQQLDDDAALGQGRAARRACAALHGGRGPRARRAARAYDVRASIAHAEMLHAQGLLAADDCRRFARAWRRLREEHAEGEWQIELERRGRPDRAREAADGADR